MMALRSDHNATANQLMRRPPSGNVSYQSSFPDDEDARLERKALEAKTAAQRVRKSIPPFVQKLSSFLDESRNTELIRWSDSGDSFIVLDEDEFARTLIPELFKHNNYASFVRQLNMYGFHKRVGLSDNSMRASERKNKTPSEYYNPYFKRGRSLLLWLIQKPKGTTSKPKGGAKGRADGEGEDDADETFEGENLQSADLGDDGTAPSLRGQPLMISDGDRSLRPNELQAVNEQLRQIRQQQHMITTMLSKIRQEHEQLYGQAAAFTELHNRHENSINAILTFLATVYNRSLEGQSGQNMAGLFTGAIPHDMQQTGNIVDVGDLDGQGLDLPGAVARRPSRKQLLLRAPPNGGQQGQMPGKNVHQNNSSRAPAAASPSYSQMDTPTPYSQVSGQVEEIYDQDSHNQNMRTPAGGGSPGQDFMSLINSANARDGNTPKNMDFPQALSHLQTADGKSPLSPQQREDVLQLMANSHGSKGSNNALVSPAPPNVPTLDNWNTTEQDLQHLEKTLKEQGANVEKLTNMLEPLSPSGSIPGVSDSQYQQPPDALDLNSYFDTAGYFGEVNTQDFGDTNGLDFGNGDFDFSNAQNDALVPDWNAQQQNDGAGTRSVETVSSSEATSPANTLEENNGGDGRQNPRKRRRKG